MGDVLLQPVGLLMQTHRVFDLMEAAVRCTENK